MLCTEEHCKRKKFKDIKQNSSDYSIHYFEIVNLKVLVYLSSQWFYVKQR